jgi:hypothetical protein
MVYRSIFTQFPYLTFTWSSSVISQQETLNINLLFL